VTDHAALTAAAELGRVVPVFVLDDQAAGKWKLGAASRWWLHHSLVSLGGDLQRLGTRLILRRGSAETEIAEIATLVGASQVHAGKTAEPWARSQDQRVETALARLAIKFIRHRTAMMFDQDTVRTRSGAPFQIYSAFARTCHTLGEPPPPVSAPSRLLPPALLPRSDALEAWGLLPTKPDWAGGIRATWTPGEKAAQARLERFVADQIDQYVARRDRPAAGATSRLSPHLRWGEISAATIWHAASAVPGIGPRKFNAEVLWREFSHHLLWHHPDLPERPLNEVFASMPWRRDKRALRNWEKGQTGIPIVDAGMRQLWETGWMHNRVRMITASFLIKHLLIDWREGEEWFWDTLVDADLANNSASWQWVAGCGADAAPYFRIFNPVLQARKFDPDGTYIHRFVPDLAKVAAPAIHAPWEATESLLREAGVGLGQTYPKPMIDLSDGRARALAAFAKLRGTPRTAAS
jgi:deoxyribodipyrimidine photo-lyase